MLFFYWFGHTCDQMGLYVASELNEFVTPALRDHPIILAAITWNGSFDYENCQLK